MSKILVVEDDTAIASMYKFKLELEGYEVACTHDGEAGLATAESFLPDLLLLDLRMPLMNGDEMLELLRSNDWGAGMRVIVLTNISRDEAPAKLRFLGVDRYIVKAHHTPAQVVRVVADILQPDASAK